jgi:hypothetical protein
MFCKEKNLGTLELKKSYKYLGVRNKEIMINKEK